MGFTVARLQASANSTIKGAAAPAAITHVSAHTADPSSSGLNEVTGGSPPYARKAVTLADADGTATCVATNIPIEFNIPASTTVTYIGYWTAATGGTFVGSKLIPSEAFTSQGILRLTSFELDANNA